MPRQVLGGRADPVRTAMTEAENEAAGSQLTEHVLSIDKTATERIVYADQEHYAFGEEFEFFEWIFAERGHPWRRGEDLAGQHRVGEFSRLLDEGWEVMTQCVGGLVLQRMIPIPEPEPEPGPEPVALFDAYSAIPGDLADAFEQLKLTLMRHRAEGWTEASLSDALTVIDHLRSMARRPWDESTEGL